MFYWKERMYSLLYRALPGGKLAKLLQLTVLALAVVALLIFLVFPWLDSIVPEGPSING